MPDGAGEVVATVDGEERRIAGAAELQANRSLTLNLAGWGRIEVVSGSVEAATLAREKQRTETELKAVLSESGLGSLAEAEGQLIRVEQIAQEISAAAKALWARLDPFADLAACDAAAAQAAAELERHRATLAPSAEESAFSLAELEGEEQRITASVREDEQAEERLATESKAARAALESVRRAHDEAEREVTRLDERTKQLLVRKAELAARHVEGLAAAKAAAQSMFVAAEARRDEARRKLPDGHEKLHLRSVRAGDAVAEIEKSYEGKAGELERLRGALEAAGGEGIYSRASEIEERIEVVRAEVVRQRADGWAARLAAELIQRRQASAIQMVLAPLEEKLSAAFAELTGVADRRVFFNEELGIEGVGRHRAEVVPFAALSRGAREQLLLALRAAIALTFSPDDPPCLILDDVLVNTDPLRIENVLDFLQRLSAQVQIVILTCHAERYRGVGRLLSTTEG